MSTICLNMIVKNEASIIVDTLTNILANIRIDYWIIADTGSVDGTQDIIQAFFQQRGIPGELLHHLWKIFGHNRELALQAAIEKAEQGDATGITELALVMSHPYDEQTEYQSYAALPPVWAAGICVSCSS